MSAILQESRLTVRRITAADLDVVYANELAAYSHPWTRGILSDCLRVGYHCMLAELDGATVGHAFMSTAAGEAHLLNICVIPDWQKRGIGRRLLKRMLRLAGEHGADTVFLEVRASNRAAQRLYESEGFCEIGQRRAYYPHDVWEREDAVVYARPLT